MAGVPDNAGLQTVAPDVQTPDDYQHIDASPEKFGAAAARGQQALGEGEGQAAAGGFATLRFYNQLVADHGANDYQDEINKIMHGDPDKMVPGPDGKPMPDAGFMGLKGRAAMDARPGVEARMKAAEKRIKGTLLAPASELEFDSFSRRLRAVTSSQVGTHADTEQKVWGKQVAQGEIQVNSTTLTNNAEDPEIVRNSAAGIVNGYVKIAEIDGAQPGDPVWKAAVQKGEAAAARSQILAIGATDPVRGMRMTENYKAKLGADYHTLVDHFRPRAQQAEGQQTADWLLSGTAPPAGEDAKAVLRHFEGFRERPYRDNDGKFRVGYGSDTVTKADGSISPVTSETVVTREEAERDLERRAGISQQALRQKIGNEAWSRLSPQTQASLTSIAYNYGEGNIPGTVVEAARGGDPAAIAQAVRGLAGHNNGINAGRRASEASNIVPGDVLPRTQANLVNEVLSLHLPPAAETAALARISHSYAAQHKQEVSAQAALNLRVKNSAAEALNTGDVTNPIPREDFVKAHGLEKGAELYEAYQSDVQFGADAKSMETMPDAGIVQLVNVRGPQPGDAAYARKIKNQERLTAAAAKVQKQRSEDPAGSVNTTGAVKEAFRFYAPQRPETFAPVVAARIAGQEMLGIPREVQSAITEDEAKQYAAALKPVSKEGVPAQNQEEVINSVVAGVKAKYGDHAEEAMSRVLYHVTLKKDASEVMAAALVRNSKGESPQITADEAKKVQIERDAERAAQIAAQQPQRTEQVGAAVAGSEFYTPPGASLSPQNVGAVVNQTEQKTLKPFNDAVDMLRSDPARYMPYFVKKFGVTKVPPDLQQYVPKPKAAGNGG